ncbi:ATP-dependent DNA helicase PIF4 [Elysia marginata]|uniref:ATP-dependent DNA helicase n=1 Tax=Elysia marginata TaxID=1093978 RepID=A0AAV4EVQ8_9GAST|nr:ATP-dependent DNA helicase PIF4 [Elysia marginata]
MPITERYLPVVHLQIHLENFQRVYFKENTAQQVANAAPPATTLTSYFHLCATDAFAQNVLYVDIPKYYTWDATKQTWQRRKRGRQVEVGVNEAAAIGRIYTISPKQGDCFYLRLLLLSIPGPTSFQMLRTVNGTTHESYRDACLALGLLEDDNIHRQTLQEACISQSPQQLRNLFAILLTQICPSNPTELWEEFCHEMSGDYPHQTDVTEEAAKNMTLINLEDIIASIDGTSLENQSLLVPTRQADERKDKEYSRETNYSCEDQERIADANVQKLTPEQSVIYNDFTQKIQNGQSGLCFLDAPGGCGKTFFIETILASQRAKGSIAIATASTELAATLLPGGRTVHSTFKVPLNIINSETPSCSIKKGTALSRVL